MNIHTVFGLGIEMYQVYRQTTPIRFNQVRFVQNNDIIPAIERSNPAILKKYREACTYYQAFERSGHSYIAAYVTRPDYTKADSIFIQAIIAAEEEKKLTETEQYAAFVKALDISFFEHLLHRKSPFLLGVPDHPSLADPDVRPIGLSDANDLLSYSFFLEVISSKEIQVIAVLLFLVGLLAFTMGMGGFLGVGVAKTALNAISTTAMASTIIGVVSTTIGSGILFYKPEQSERTRAALAVPTSQLRRSLRLEINEEPDTPKQGAGSTSSRSSDSMYF